MALYFNPETGQWEDDDPQKQQAAGPSRVDIAEMSLDERLDLAREERGKSGDDMWAAPQAAKPAVAENPLQAAGEVFNITANAATSLVTDYGDLASYIGDTVTQLGNVAQGKRFESENFMNDADNPWTQWRLNTFEPSTQAGQAFSPIVRVGVALLTLPKTAAKYGLMPLKFLGKAPVIGKGAQGLVNTATKANKAIKGLTAVDDTADVVRSLNTLGKTVKGKNDIKLIKNVANTPWLYATYDDVGKAIAQGENLTGVQAFMSDTRQAVKGITNFGKLPAKQKIKTIGEALAWDAFVSFNAAGEGDLGFDEGLSNWLVEMDMPWAQSIGSPLATSADDAAIARKFKMTAEGTALGGILNGIFDMWRVGRFATKFRAASGDNKAAILNRFAGQAQDIGNGIGGQAVELGAGGGKGIRLGLDDLKEGEDAAEAFARQQRERDINRKADFLAAQRGGPLATTNRGIDGGLVDENGLPLIQGPGELVEPGQTAGALATTNPGRNLDALPPGALPGEPGNPRIGQPAVESQTDIIDPTIQQANVTVPPMAEPVITPQTIRAGFRESLIQKFRDQPIDLVENSSGQFVQLKDQTKALMPVTRTGMLQYMLDNPPRVNALGLENGIDSIWRNFLTDRGLQEGWATIDPNTMQVKWNRSVARDLDASDLSQKTSLTLDDAIAYNNYLSSSRALNENTADLPSDAAQQRLGQMEARQPSGPDAAGQQIENEVIDAAADAAAYENSELRRIEEAARSPVTDPDYQLVDDMLGQNLDDVPEPEIIKATTGRGWEVYGADGELLGRTQTKRAANKLADRQKRADREAVVAKARQLSEDGGDQTIAAGALDEGTTDAVSGKVKLTDRQLDALREMGVEGLEGTGKKTFEMTQRQMKSIRDQLVEAGSNTRVSRNLIDKLDTALKVMAPEVRARRTANRLLEDTESLVKNGEVCNFLDL